jgi:hypothetical protein
MKISRDHHLGTSKSTAEKPDIQVAEARSAMQMDPTSKHEFLEMFLLPETSKVEYRWSTKAIW